MNWSLLKARLRRRSIITAGRGARIYPSAEILNAQDDPAAIIIGERGMVRGELFVFGHGGRIRIGKDCFIGPGSRIWSGAEVTIGDHVLIAHNVSIMDNLTHPFDHLQRREHFDAIYTRGHPRDIDLDDKPVRIGDDAWIGAHSIVLRGVTIGDRAIVGAGSVVTRDVPADAIVAGNPARVLRTNIESE